MHPGSSDVLITASFSSRPPMIEILQKGGKNEGEKNEGRKRGKRKKVTIEITSS